jgi:hypothetical protein
MEEGSLVLGVDSGYEIMEEEEEEEEEVGGSWWY